jgi:hypothetical protein
MRQSICHTRCEDVRNIVSADPIVVGAANLDLEAEVPSLFPSRAAGFLKIVGLAARTPHGLGPARIMLPSECLAHIDASVLGEQAQPIFSNDNGFSSGIRSILGVLYISILSKSPQR